MKSGKLDVRGLFDFAGEKVPEMAKSIGGIQKPEHFSTGSDTIPLGLPTVK